MVPKLKPQAPPGPPPEWCKRNDKKRKQSLEEQQNAKHGVTAIRQFSDEHLDRWIWTAKGPVTWRQFYDKNGCV